MCAVYVSYGGLASRSHYGWFSVLVLSAIATTLSQTWETRFLLGIFATILLFGRIVATIDGNVADKIFLDRITLTFLAAPLAFADVWQGWLIAVAFGFLDARNRWQWCTETNTNFDKQTACLWFYASNIFLVVGLYASMHVMHWMVTLPIRSGDPLEIIGFLGLLAALVGNSVAASNFLWAQAFARSEATTH